MSQLMTSNNSFVLSTTTGIAPPAPPKGLIATRAVQIKDGWVGQVLVDQEIVWETDTITEAAVGEDEKPGDVAQQLANDAVINRIKSLFSDDLARQVSDEIAPIKRRRS